MNVYMLQDVDTKKFYKRRGGWIEQSGGAIWTSKNGPNAAKGSHWVAADRNVAVRTFQLEEIDED
jgi:hypothetical protein